MVLNKPENNDWLKFRWIIALLGISLVVLGQWKINVQVPSDAPPLPFGTWLTEQIHLGDPNVDQVLYSIPLFIAGGILLGLAFRGIPLTPPPQTDFRETPLAFKFFLSKWRWYLIGFGFFACLLFRLGSPEFSWLDVSLWLISLSLILVAVLYWDQRRSIDFSLHVTRRDLLWMTGLVAVGIVLGAYRLQGMPDQLVGDDGNFWTVARDIALNKFQPSIFAPGVYSFPVFSSYIQAWFLKLFGISLWGWRFGSVLTGLATVLPLYLLVREMFDRNMAIVSSIALITNPYFIDFSRLGYNNIQALFFTTLALTLLYFGLNKRSSLYLYLAGCMAGLGFYTFFAARMALVISLLFILFLWFMKKCRFKTVLHAIGMLGLGFVLVVTPYLIYGYRVDPQGLSYKSFESVFFNSFNGLQYYSKQELFSVAPPLEINGNELFYNPRIYAVLISRGFIRTMLAFQKSGLISEHFIAFPLAGSIGAVFYLIGLVLACLTAKQSRSALLIIWFFVNIIGLSTLNTVPPRQTHMVAIIPALAILTAIGLTSLATAAATILPRLRKYQSVLLIVLIGLIAAGGSYDFFVRSPEQYHAQPSEVISWATLESHNESIVYLYADPSQKDFVPYSEVIRENVPYEAVPAADVISGKKTFTSQPTVVFYPPDISTNIIPALQKQWGDDLINRSFYSTGGELVLSAGMNTPFVFERDKGAATVLKDSYLIPSLDIFLALILGFFVLIFFLPKSIVLKIQAFLKPVADRFLAPVESFHEEINPEMEEEIIPPTPMQVIRPSEPTKADIKTDLQPPDENSEGFLAQVNTVNSKAGVDYYIHFRIPRIVLPEFHLPRFQFPQRIQSKEAKSEWFAPVLNIPDSALLAGGIVSAIAAQMFISGQLIIYGLLAYAACTISLIFWARRNAKWTNILPYQLNLRLSLEILVAGLVFLLVGFTRFFDLNHRVYGLEADETKWTVQSWYSTILRVDLGEFATMHYNHLPVDFWFRSIFLRLFGVNFISARFESATLSLIAVICLYFIVRLLTKNSAVAVLASLLYGFSFMELNASHQALQDTPPAGWMIAALCFLVWGIQERKLWQFQISGLILAAGMLTYETFYPTSMIAILYLAGLAIYEIIHKKESVRNWFKILVVIAWPIALIYFSYTSKYLGEQAYHFNGLTDVLGTGLLPTVGFLLKNINDIFTTTFIQVVWNDSLINWTGPIVNPLLLPFVVIGFIYNLWNLRRPHLAFIIVWYFGQVTPAPILLGSTWPRVLYMTLAPLMIWGALGLWVTFGVFRAVLSNRSKIFAVPIFVLIILAIILNDYHIFTTQLLDPLDRQKRRELSDLTFSSASSTPMILYPYMPNQDDSLELESHVLLFSVAGARHIGLEAAAYYKQLTQASLLPTLWQLKGTDSLDLFYDKTANSFQDEHLKSLQNVLRCYPHAILKSSARFFDVYHLGSQDLDFPLCYSPTKPTTDSPKETLPSTEGQSIPFKWNTNGVETNSFSLTLEHKLDNIFWIEAENFQGPGWHPESSFVNDFSGSGFLMDDEHAGQANYDFIVPSAGQYEAWVRFYKRRVNDQHNFLDIGGQRLEFADNSSTLNEWVWKDMGAFNLAAGDSPLALTRTYGSDEEYSVFIDSIVITSNLNYHPTNEDSEWQVVKSTGEIISTASEYPLGVDLLPGKYRWTVKVFDANKIVDSAGEPGIESEVTYFTVQDK